MYIKVSSVCSEHVPHSRSRCAEKPSHGHCSFVRFHLKHFRPSSVGWLALWPHGAPPPPLPPPAGLDCGRRRRVQFTLSPGLSAVILCAMWLPASRVTICCILLWVEWHLFAVFKTGDVFMSLIYECPWPRFTSSHVGTVCWLRVIPQCLVLFACDQGGKWTPASTRLIGCGWLFYLPFIFGRIISSEILTWSTNIYKTENLFKVVETFR